jgi:hypothetical protein
MAQKELLGGEDKQKQGQISIQELKNAVNSFCTQYNVPPSAMLPEIGRIMDLRRQSGGDVGKLREQLGQYMYKRINENDQVFISRLNQGSGGKGNKSPSELIVAEFGPKSPEAKAPTAVAAAPAEKKESPYAKMDITQLREEFEELNEIAGAAKNLIRNKKADPVNVQNAREMLPNTVKKLEDVAAEMAKRNDPRAADYAESAKVWREFVKEMPA